MSTMRDRRPLSPSSCLTAASNAALPVLSSHWESVAQIQAQRARAAAEAQNNALAIAPSLSITPPVLAHVDLDHSRSIAGSLPITLTTSSIPPSTAPPSESESNSDKPSMTAAKGKNK
jgi:hypothetical protein